MPNPRTKSKTQKTPSQQQAQNKLFAYLTQTGLLTEPFAVACSAGLDSLSLLYAAVSIVGAANVTCVHFDHAVRPDSQLAEQYLKKLCKTLSIAYYSQRNSSKLKKTDEDTLRKQRYDFFVKACKTLSLSHILSAHHLNDDIETILFRLFRGSGPAGISGIRKTREIDTGLWIHRPWLDLERSEIESYAKSKKIKAIEDSSNKDLKYSRNFIRLKLVPEITKINPQALRNIKTLTKLIQEQNLYLEKQVTQIIGADLEKNWDRAWFCSLDRAVQRKLLERKFTTNLAFCDEFLSAIAKGGFHKINFAKGKYFAIRQKKIKLELD